MSLLSKITTGRIGRAQKVVFYGPEGIGKSSLASLFPNPLFADIEGSTSQLDIARLGRDDIADLDAFDGLLQDVAKTKPCKTFVTDTIDWLEQMAADSIIAAEKNPKIKGIEDFGYGKGYTALRERINITMARFDAVIASGIHVVLLAHSKVVKFEPPEGAGPYDRYELKLSKQVAPLVKEWADMVIFGNWRSQVRERDKNESGAQFKGVGGRERMLYCNRAAAWDAKNRHGLADEEKWGKDAAEAVKVFERAFKSVGAPWDTAISQPAKEVAHVTPEAQQPAKSAPVAVTPPPVVVEEKPDEIPGLEGMATLDPALAAICTPHGDAITAFLLDLKKIAPGETWAAMPKEYAERVLKNPAAFIKKVTGGAA